MGRWSQYDEDSYRLPEGMERIGYDADTQTYIYRDSDQSTWHGEPGARYGQLRQTALPSIHRGAFPSTYSSPTSPMCPTKSNESDDIHDSDLTPATPTSGSASNGRKSSWAPFAGLRRTFSARLQTIRQVHPDDTDSEKEEEKKQRRQARRASFASAARAVEKQGQTGLRRAQTFLSRRKPRNVTSMELKTEKEKAASPKELLSTQELREKMGGGLDGEAAKEEDEESLGEEKTFAPGRSEVERSGLKEKVGEEEEEEEEQ